MVATRALVSFTGHPDAARPSATLLLIAVRPDRRGTDAAHALARHLRSGGQTGPDAIHVAHSHQHDLAARLRRADHVLVLDPGRLRCFAARLRGTRRDPMAPAFTAPARSADRFRLIRLLADHRDRVTWAGTPRQIRSWPAHDGGRPG